LWLVRVAIVGLGSNLGDRAATLASAVGALGRIEGARLAAVSPVYETEPVGPPQPRYLNAAVRLETDLDAEPLLDALLAIEAAHGRARREKWGPRTLDLDVLAILDAGRPLEIRTPRLEVPHPALLDRAFALAPLLDVAPELSERWSARLFELGGPPPRSQSVVVPGRHR
jgi:2-amino-4-hydroxy-6-hydroxymethyldihydropteridine diphosphokinase